MSRQTSPLCSHEGCTQPRRPGQRYCKAHHAEAQRKVRQAEAKWFAEVGRILTRELERSHPSLVKEFNIRLTRRK